MPIPNRQIYRMSQSIASQILLVKHTILLKQVPTVAYEAGILRFTFFGLFAIHSIVPGVVDLCRTPGLAAEGIDVIVF